jgi:hypothetical protein
MIQTVVQYSTETILVLVQLLFCVILLLSKKMSDCCFRFLLYICVFHIQRMKETCVPLIECRFQKFTIRWIFTTNTRETRESCQLVQKQTPHLFLFCCPLHHEQNNKTKSNKKLASTRITKYILFFLYYSCHLEMGCCCSSSSDPTLSIEENDSASFKQNMYDNFFDTIARQCSCYTSFVMHSQTAFENRIDWLVDFVQRSRMIGHDQQQQQQQQLSNDQVFDYFVLGTGAEDRLLHFHLFEAAYRHALLRYFGHWLQIIPSFVYDSKKDYNVPSVLKLDNPIPGFHFPYFFCLVTHEYMDRIQLNDDKNISQQQRLTLASDNELGKIAFHSVPSMVLKRLCSHPFPFSFSDDNDERQVVWQYQIVGLIAKYCFSLWKHFKMCSTMQTLRLVPLQTWWLFSSDIQFGTSDMMNHTGKILELCNKHCNHVVFWQYLCLRLSSLDVEPDYIFSFANISCLYFNELVLEILMDTTTNGMSSSLPHSLSQCSTGTGNDRKQLFENVFLQKVNPTIAWYARECLEIIKSEKCRSLLERWCLKNNTVEKRTQAYQIDQNNPSLYLDMVSWLDIPMDLGNFLLCIFHQQNNRYVHFKNWLEAYLLRFPHHITRDQTHMYQSTMSTAVVHIIREDLLKENNTDHLISNQMDVLHSDVEDHERSYALELGPQLVLLLFFQTRYLKQASKVHNTFMSQKLAKQKISIDYFLGINEELSTDGRFVIYTGGKRWSRLRALWSEWNIVSRVVDNLVETKNKSDEIDHSRATWNWSLVCLQNIVLRQLEVELNAELCSQEFGPPPPGLGFVQDDKGVADWARRMRSFFIFNNTV